MADRIVQRISLEGAEDVQAKLKKTGEVGAKALAATNRTIDDSNSGLGKYGNVFAGLNGKTEESRESIERVKRLVETIKPAAEKAGLELGGIGEFGKIGRGGVIALAGAVGTTLVAALEKAGDTARDQAQRLGSFTGSAQSGVENYNAVKKTAGELELPSSGLAAPFEQLLRANQRSDAGLDGNGIQSVLKTLFEGAQADRVPLDKSQEGITGLLGGLREQGQLTPEASKAAQEIFPTLMKRLSEDLTKSFPDQVAPFTTPQVLKSLQSIGPQIGKDLEATKNAFPPSIEDSLNKLKSSAGNLGDALNGTTIVSTVFDGAAKFLETVAGGIKKIKDSAGALPTAAPTVPLEEANRVRDQRGLGPVQGPQLYPPRPPSTLAPEATPVGIRFLQYIFGIKGQAYQPEGGRQPEASTEASTGATPKWQDVGDAAAKLGENLSGAADKAKSAEQIFDEFNKKGTEQLGVIGSKLTTEQARIDYEHKPEETDIQIGRDQLAVQNAAIAKQSAQIGLQDAAKGKELAGLAPEQADNASRDAESRYTKALKNLRQLQGYDTDAIQDNPLKDARNELRDADTARKVADVNRRYADLEPQKAELAQKKAQTDLTSSDYLQRDTSLKLTKDAQGRQLSSDVAGLRYAQAQLDEQQKIAKSGDVSVGLLDKILATLSGSKSDKSEDRGPGERSGQSGERRSGDSRSRFGDAGDGSPSHLTASASGRDLLGSDGVVNIPQGASQEEISRALTKQRSTQSESTLQQPESKRDTSVHGYDQAGRPLYSRRPGFDSSGFPIPELEGKATNQYELGKQLLDQQEFSAADGEIHRKLTNSIRDQIGLPHETPQSGKAPHPKGGTADLTERMTIPFFEEDPEQPRRYRYQAGPNYEPPTLGRYDPDGNTNFHPLPNSKQPYPRLRDKPFLSDRPYSPLDDTFDTKGDGGHSVPIYDYGQNQPLTFPSYNQYQRDTLPEPPPWPRPPGAGPGRQGSLPSSQDSFPQTEPPPQPRPPEAYPIQDPVPLPQPRPPEAGPGQQGSLPSPQDVTSLGEAFRSLIDGISAELAGAKPQGNAAANPDASSASGEGKSSDGATDLGESADNADKSLEDLAQAFSAAAGTIRGDAAPADQPTYAATGGLITGPGSTTSDSIPAMLSRDEFVVNAAATQKHIGLLHAINSGKEIGFKHLAIGGPVGFMGNIGLPHVSSGSIASTGTPGHLGTVDLRTNHGEFKMMASQDVARQMSRAAGDAALAQTGRRPAWYEGR